MPATTPIHLTAGLLGKVRMNLNAWNVEVRESVAQGQGLIVEIPDVAERGELPGSHQCPAGARDPRPPQQIHLPPEIADVAKPMRGR
jgi:hypothetical protein